MPRRPDPLVIDGYLLRSYHRFPDDIALAEDDRHLTFAEVDEKLTQLAHACLGVGAGPGDRVVLLLENSIEAAIALLAPQRFGGMAVPVNARLTAAEVAYIVQRTEPVVIVADLKHLHRLAEIGPGAGVRSILVVGGGAALTDLGPPVPGADLQDFAATLDAARTDPIDSPAAGGDGAFILFTSGTTGRPKGAVLGHAGYIANSLGALASMRMTDRHEIRHVGVPMFHSGGVNTILQQYILGGTSLISEPGGMRAPELISFWERHGAFTCFLTPTQWEQVCDTPGLDARALTIGRIIWGASKPSPTVLDKLSAHFPGVPVFANFGMTETSGTVSSLSPEFARTKITTVGKPLGHIQLRVVDPAMSDVAVGEVGEVVYQGPPVLREYWRDPQATDAAFAGGWFHSGDLARFDEDGFLTIVDRLKDMIVSGGENIYSSEVEHALLTHPKVSEVVVVGAPDPKWVETPKAYVVASDPDDPPTLEELHDHLRPVLASYKKPTALVVVEALPRNAMGKLLRHELKNRAAEEGAS